MNNCLVCKSELWAAEADIYFAVGCEKCDVSSHDNGKRYFFKEDALAAFNYLNKPKEVKQTCNL